LDVDPLPFHLGETIVHARESCGDRRAQERANVGLCLRETLEQRPDFRDDEVRMHVDRAHAAPADRDWAAAPSGARVLRPYPAATVQRDARRGGSG